MSDYTRELSGSEIVGALTPLVLIGFAIYRWGISDVLGWFAVAVGVILVGGSALWLVVVLVRFVLSALAR